MKSFGRPTSAALLKHARSQTATTTFLPARFDDTDIPGLLATTGFIDLRKLSPAEVAVRVAEKLGRDPLASKAPAVPAPNSPPTSGTARFDFRKFDGRFRIGSGAYEFETRWTNGSDRSIHSYSHGHNVRAIGLAPFTTPVPSINVTDVDFTCSSVTPVLGQDVVLQNTNGFYAAIRVDASRRASKARRRLTSSASPIGSLSTAALTFQTWWNLSRLRRTDR